MSNQNEVAEDTIELPIEIPQYHCIIKEIKKPIQNPNISPFHPLHTNV